MKIFNILLEGKEKNNLYYFINYKVIAENKDVASKICIENAKEKKLDIFNIEEIEQIEKNIKNKISQIVEISGKSYFSKN